jgi:hypothetical protein
MYYPGNQIHLHYLWGSYAQTLALGIIPKSNPRDGFYNHLYGVPIEDNISSEISR